MSARKLSDAQEFARKFDIPTAYEGNEEMAANPNVGKSDFGALILYEWS